MVVGWVLALGSGMQGGVGSEKAIQSRPPFRKAASGVVVTEDYYLKK